MKKLKTFAGGNFTDVAKEAKAVAEKESVVVQFDFNGVDCRVDSSTNLDSLYRDYANSWMMDWKTVGPDCPEKYSDEVQKEHDRRKKERDEKAAIQEAEYRAKEQREKESFEEMVKGIELELSDVDGWNKSREANRDPYGKAALDYAEGWAKLMQIEIAKGKTVAQCAEHTQNNLSFLGITGFMYGCAVNLLSQCWKHGEELRLWHNKQYGVSEDKKGVVNPAILTIG